MEVVVDLELLKENGNVMYVTTNLKIKMIYLLIKKKHIIGKVDGKMKELEEDIKIRIQEVDIRIISMVEKRDRIQVKVELEEEVMVNHNGTNKN